MIPIIPTIIGSIILIQAISGILFIALIVGGVRILEITTITNIGEMIIMDMVHGVMVGIIHG